MVIKDFILMNPDHRFDDSGMNLTIRDQPIFEDENQAQQAMDDMANTLRMVSYLKTLKPPQTSYSCIP